MAQALQLFILLPLLGFLISLLVPRKNEKLISGITMATAVPHLFAVVGFVVYWLWNQYPTLDIKHITFFKTNHIEIFIDFYFDAITAVFALVGSLLTLLVALFSRYYLHREAGYKRFFSTLLLFFLGYNLVVFSGNFETLFIGWEVLGICSFLLIAFYRDRYLPVKNGLKVISVYRLGDMCLILVMWMSHQLWHQNITFLQLNDAALVQGHLQEVNGYALFIALMILVAAAVKSAQAPFSSWLPRAMEGPTTSSAIFYGSLSVHLGVFLLLRTYPYWQGLLIMKLLVIIIGVITSLVATSTARVQSSVKTQIAYSSITQIGIIFIEVAMGWHTLALIHFAGNAFLRTYQLLVSPSVLSYLIHDMVFSFKPPVKRTGDSFGTRLKNSVYILSLKEWNLDQFQYRLLWSPFKWIGNQCRFLTRKVSVVVMILLLIAGIYFDVFPEQMPKSLSTYLPHFFSVVGLLLVLTSFTERGNARKAWLAIVAGQLFIVLSIALFHQEFSTAYMLIYLSGALLSGITGYVCLFKLEAIESDLTLNRFHGHTYEYPVLSLVFLVSCLGIAGLPFTPTFIGIDLLFSHIQKGEIVLILVTALSFIFIEIAVIRIYARIFLGQHKKAYHPIAYRSS